MRLPEAVVDIDSPYFQGEVTATCLENPLYDVVLGNIVGVRHASDPDVQWRAEENLPLPLQEEPTRETPSKNRILGN